MANQAPLVSSVRSDIIQEKKRLGRSFFANMRAYRSTVQLGFQIVDKIPLAAPTVAHAICRPQVWDFFGYGQGDSIPWGPTTRRANASDTNITKSKTTVSNEDLAIEGVSATLRGMRVGHNAVATDVNDPDVQRAYLGQTTILDPMAKIMPIQGQSPIMLESTFFEAIKPFCTLEFDWDNGKRTEKIAQLDQIPEGGAKSYLRSSGDPRIDNRFRIPAGHKWMRNGTPADSEFIARLTLTDAVVLPVNPVMLAGATVATFPAFIYLDLTLRLHAFAVSSASGN